jgi:8-oxo-dGTP pyrophosphatase MutT (NUDIX family)
MPTSHEYKVLSSRRIFEGRVLVLRSDVVAMPGDVSSQRDVTELPGAVAIVALNELQQVLLVRQYRHPVGRHLWEIPAGLLDSAEESVTTAAERELFEEGGLRALSWQTLVDVLTSPGMSDETVRVLLARGLSTVSPAERHVPFHEEADMELRCVPLDQAADMVLAGEIENGISGVGLLAAAHLMQRGGDGRPAEAPWPARKGPR